MTDRELLNAYTNGGSQDAFRTLVLRYIDLVYAAAVRKVGNAALAEDVTQAVFIVLSRRAARIHDARFLPAWLLQVTRFCAADARRAETRRRVHEKEAGAMTHDPTATENLAPRLDAALEQLSPADRTAILLRYYQQQSFADVGASLGVSEDAAKKRLARAMEKLRKIFTRQGMTFSAALLATAVARQALAAPPALAEKACAAALAKTAAAGTAALIAKGALKLMAWTTAKTIAAAAVAVVVLSAGTAGAVHVLSHAPAAPHVTTPVAAAAPAPADPNDPPGLNVRDALGRPLGNVYVSVEGVSNRRPAQTDRHGHLDLDAFPLTSNHLILESMRSRRMAMVTLSANYSPDMAIDAVCDCFDANADGVVVDSAGDPVPGVTVNVFVSTPDGQTFRFPEKTDATGYYIARIPAKTSYTCWAAIANNSNDPGTTARIPLADEYQVELPDIRLKTASGTPAASTVKRVHYGGRVVDEQGHPIPNVELDLSYPKNHMSYDAGDVLTDANGRFSRLLPPDADRIDIRLTARDYIGYQFEHGETTVSTDALKAGTAVITMKRGLPLSGIVTDAAGKPLSNALILTGTMYSGGGGEIIEDYTSPRTDNDGRFTATGLPAGPAHLQIFADGYAPQLATVDLSAATATIHITLQPGLTYTARVTDPSGHPVSDANVEVERWRTTNQTLFAVSRSARTDSDGNFTLADLPREGTLEINFSKRKFVDMTLLHWSAGAQNPGKIVLIPTPVITGVALDDATGRPVPDFTVFPAWYNGNEASTIEFSKSKTVHSEQGRFSLAITNFGASVENPNPMAVRIVAEGYMPQFSPPVPLDGSKHSVTIRLHAAAPITGTLRDADHQPVANAKVFINGAKNYAQIQGIALNDALVASPTGIVTTDDDGAFKLPAMEPPAKLVALCPSGYVLVDAATLAPDATLTLTPWGTVEGTLEKDGHPQNGVGLRLMEPMFDPRAPAQVHFDQVATTDIHGHFRFQYVPNIPLRLVKNGTNEVLVPLIHPEPGKTITVLPEYPTR